MEEREYTASAAREAFMGRRRSTLKLTQAIASSWKRSRDLEIDVQRREAPLASEPELFRRKSHSAEFLRAAGPALNRTSRLLSGSGSMIILTDSDGFIIEAGGDARVIDAGRRNHLEVGGHWQEKHIGTNAIGTALIEKRPVEICGAEHFCQDVQRWACAAKPIYHPISGKLVGLIDLSGPVNNFNPQSLALAISVGHEIEATLDQLAKIEHEQLFRRFLLKRSVWLNEEIIVTDRRGIVIHATEAVHRGLDIGSPEELAAGINEIFGSSGVESWAELCRRRFPRANVEIVEEDGRPLGAMMVIRRSSCRPSQARGQPLISESSISFPDIIGESPKLQDARERAAIFAESGLPVLIEGETVLVKNCLPARFTLAAERGGRLFL